MLMPEVVTIVEDDNNPFRVGKDGKARVRNWAANPSLFPCELSANTMVRAPLRCVATAGTGRLPHERLQSLC